MPKTILVTGAGGNASQNFIRSLRMSGEDLKIIGADTNKFHLATSPVDERIIVPPCSDSSYIGEIEKIVKKYDVGLVHAQPDVEVRVLSENREKFPVCLPSKEAIVLSQDKLKTNLRLRTAGVPVPMLDTWGDEVVWVRAIRGAGSKAALPVKSQRMAYSWINYWVETKGMDALDFMFSEFLPGKEFAFQSLWYNGELVTSAARERVEYLMGNLFPSGQSSSPSVALSVHREDVNRIGTGAVLVLDKKPHGIYCVDMKENKNGIPCVTEINAGRFFTTSDFFSTAGCNMPYLYMKMAFGEELPDMKRYDAVESGIYWVRGVDKAPQMFRNL